MGIFFFLRNVEFLTKISLGVWNQFKLKLKKEHIHHDYGCFCMFNYLREVWFARLINNPIKFGGPEIEIQIDETVIVKRKYHREAIIQEQWASPQSHRKLCGWCELNARRKIQWVSFKNAWTAFKISFLCYFHNEFMCKKRKIIWHFYSQSES